MDVNNSVVGLESGLESKFLGLGLGLGDQGLGLGLGDQGLGLVGRVRSESLLKFAKIDHNCFDTLFLCTRDYPC